MRKFFVPIIVLVAISMLLVACGEKTPKVDQSSMEATAKSFVKAMIEGDKEVIDLINESYEYPTAQLLQIAGRDFQGLDIGDFTFEVDEEENEVRVESPNRVDYYEMVLIDGKYYITDY